MVTDGVDQLEQTVREDEEAIVTATDTAMESLAVANNLTQQIIIIQVKRKKPNIPHIYTHTNIIFQGRVCPSPPSHHVQRFDPSDPSLRIIFLED